MYDLPKKILISLICGLLIFYPEMIVTAKNAPLSDSLLNALGDCTTDTCRVKTLFQLGNQFFDGPSDSLLHYYFRSVELIDKNLGGENISTAEIRLFKQFKLRALIELGIEYFSEAITNFR